MPYDITFCGGQKCPLKENCLRYTGVAYGRRDFFGSAPYDFTMGRCEHYWDDRPSDEKNRNLAYKLWQQDGCKHGLDLEYWLQAQNQLIDNKRNS
jgi:hypothetical protein